MGVRRVNFAYGTLTEHRKVSTLVDCHLMRATSASFWTVVEAVDAFLTSRGIRDYQLLINNGKIAAQFRIAVQVKLMFDNDKEALFADPTACRDSGGDPERGFGVVLDEGGESPVLRRPA